MVRKILIIIILSLIAAIFVLVPGKQIFAQTESDQALLEKYAPVLYFHPAEIFRPQPVEVLVDNARLRKQRAFWFDTNIMAQVSISDLFAYRDDSYFLDAWYGDEELSDNKNYSFHRYYYETVLQPAVGGPPMVTYGRLVEDENTGAVVLQYWLFYYYNDWFNKHEGDWELIQVMLSEDGEPQNVVLSQHHGGTRRVWRDTQIEDGTHPVVFVALGSHANYFWGDEVYPNGQDVGNTRLEIIDRTGSFGRVIPAVTPLPAANDNLEEADSLTGNEWLLFGGNWGETATVGDFGGPTGPTQKGQQWQQPYPWGLDQPLDGETWYANRMRVQVYGDAAIEAEIRFLNARGQPIAETEDSTNLAILHRDPNPAETILVEIEWQTGTVEQIMATWPDAENAQVQRFVFEDIPAAEAKILSMRLSANLPAELLIADHPEAIQPTLSETVPTTWDAIDFVWMVNLLPAAEIAKGISISILAAMIPTLVFMGMVYWADRYEKEPKRLMAVVFLWGAAPALIVSLLARVFIQLPVGAFSPTLVAAIRTGAIIPLIEEMLKGAIVLFILLRHRREFDDSLDGIVYGSLVGFGFAMSKNMIGFLSGFFVHGYSALGAQVLITGAIYTLNQAAYSAIFGAGLGYARMSHKPGARRCVPLLAFFLAVAAHIGHNVAVHAATGFNVLTMILTLGGFILLGIISSLSLRKQRQWIREELNEQLPGELYDVVVSSARRAQVQWRALFSQGYRSWRRERLLHQSCTEMAFKLRQSRLFPLETELLADVEMLRKDIDRLIAEQGGEVPKSSSQSSS
jgi:protease PrsW